MQGTGLTCSLLHGADLSSVKMQGADLSYTKMKAASFRGAELNAALVAGADFTGAIALTFDQLASAFGDGATRLPPDLEAERPRLIEEARWERYEIPSAEMERCWAAWRNARNL